MAIEELNNNTAVDLWDVLSTQPCKGSTQCCHDLQHSTQQEADKRGSTSTLNLTIFSYLSNGTITDPRVDVEITDSTVAPTQRLSDYGATDRKDTTAEATLEFVSTMVQTLNLILLTASELSDQRSTLAQALWGPSEL